MFFSVMEMTEPLSIESLEEFNRIISENKGYIVVTDRTRWDHVHLPNCKYLGEEHFKKKVIVNKKQNGAYFWFENFQDIKKEFPKINPCSYCKS